MKNLLAACLFAFAGSAVAVEPSPEAAATIVLYNLNDEASQALAKYYAGKRGIPEAQLIGLPVSAAEEISRDEYLVTIESPVRAAFTKFGWWETGRDVDGRRIVKDANKRFVAIMRGVPLKILADPRTAKPGPSDDKKPQDPMEMLAGHTEASVDSELAMLFSLREDLPGFRPNSYFRAFVSILKTSPATSPLLVCRLDGPSDAVVRRMIDDSIAAERTALWGWAYIDARNIHSGGYADGDEWLTAASTMMRRQGIPVIDDYAPETFPDAFPVTDAAIYYGWYLPDIGGPFAHRDFRFLPGAIAVHLHSYSARTLRNPKVGWAAPLLADGAAATMGNVYEPFLQLTIHFDILQDRLMNGLTLAESAYAAYPGLSWMGIVVGDPLYRPYAAWFDLTDHPATIWRSYRSTVLAAGGDVIAAADALHELARENRSSMPLEALGQAQAAAGEYDASLATLEDAAKQEKKKPIRFRIALEEIEILRRAARLKEARAKIASVLGTFQSDDARIALGRIALAIDPPPTPAPKEKP